MNSDKMKHLFCTGLASILLHVCAAAQDGTAWIDYTRSYYSFGITEDGVCRIPAATLQAAGLTDVHGADFRLYRLGEEVPLYVSTSGVFTSGDFIEFVGYKNRGELDRALYADPDVQQLNPAYSMFTDTAVYFLTWQTSGAGKRIIGIENDLSNPPMAEPYYLEEVEWIFHNALLDPRNSTQGGGISYSRYQEAEGWGTQSQTQFELTLPSASAYLAGPVARLHVRLASSTYSDHNIIALLDADTVLSNGTSNYFRVYQIADTISSAQLDHDPALQMRDLAMTPGFVVSHVTWTYPHQPDALGRSSLALLSPSSGQSQYYTLTNFSHGETDPVVIDISAGVRLLASRNNTEIQFVLPQFQGERKVYVVNPASDIQVISALSERTFIDYQGDDPEYIIITDSRLRSGDDIVGKYADYRASPAGGGYRVGIYHIQDLRDQFAYGIGKHPEAIRNFNRMLRDHWPSARMILIIGKGISYAYSRMAGSHGEELNFVPTFGQPGADHLLFTENGISLPDLPVGRLPVTSPAQLEIYLSKLQEHDQVMTLPQTVEGKSWIKHLLHLGGGQDATQQQQLLDYLDAMAENVIHSPFGGDVTTFSKNNTNTTGQSNSDKIVETLKAGVSVVKFFGHSSSSTLDFQINNPRDWQNKGKYPVFSAMGCKAGDIHQEFQSLSESFVFEPDAGTIAFIAGSGSQFQNTLGNWGVDWYDTFGHDAQTLTLGETIHESLKSVNQFGGLSQVLLVEQQTLNGDPAVRFYPMPGPDYLWDQGSVRIEPDIVTTAIDSFTLYADMLNIGLNDPGPVSIHVTQRYPDGNTHEVVIPDVEASTFRTRVVIRIPVSTRASGLNTINLTIDADNLVHELPAPAAEDNNDFVKSDGSRGFDVFILDNRARAISPIEFSIVTEEKPTLVVSSSNAFIENTGYVIELDTTPDFNSPLLNSVLYQGVSGLFSWQPPTDLLPGTVYFWRVSSDQGSTRIWDTSSFLFEPGGSQGWHQSHIGQFRKDQMINLDLDNQNHIAFDTVYRNFWFQNKIDVDPDLTDDPVVYVNNGLRRDFFTFFKDYDAHFFAVAIDSFTGRALGNSPGGLYGSVNPSQSILSCFPYHSGTPENRNNLVTFLRDVVRDGQYVILYSYQRPGYMDYFPGQWADDSTIYGTNIFDIVEAQAPGSQIRHLEETGSVPYLLFYRKNRALLYEGIANQLEETISFDYNFPSRFSSGELISTLIGPASQWASCNWSFEYSDNPANDNLSAEVVGISADMTDSISLDITDIQDTSLTFIDAQSYPYLFMRFRTQDQQDLTAARVSHWEVLYEGVPDLVINPTGLIFISDSLLAGQPMFLQTVIENHGTNMDTAAEVRLTITDAQNRTYVLIDALPALASGESRSVTFMTDTILAPGRGSIVVEVNPMRSIYESSYLNNTGIINFTLIPDTNKPLLDVTFDGRHLRNGDIVSTHPTITATLTDDQPYLLLTEREDFQVFLRYPGTFDYAVIDLHSADVTFTPADSSSRRAVLTLSPLLASGVYEMLVQAKDVSGNPSGVIEYAITFEVLDETRISVLGAQPTAFNDHTTFVFTISGTTPPDEITLEIINVSGQIVRTIGSEEIGKFIGTTEYIWPGTTDSGEPLPGGIYFYRLTARDSAGRAYPITGSGARPRKGGYSGKLVIVR